MLIDILKKTLPSRFEPQLKKLFWGDGSDEKELVRWILFLSASLGFVYGCLVHPIYSEMVEWAQNISGIVPANFQNARRLTQFTLQTDIPALLLLAGVPVNFLLLFFSGAVAALSFSAWSLCAHLFVRSPLFCATVPLLFFRHPIPNYHFYPVSFPLDYFIFGQVGFYVALFSILMLCHRHYKLAGVLAGALPLIHAPWAIGLSAPILFYVFTRKRFPGGRPALTCFAGSLVFSLLVFSFAKTLWPTPNTEIKKVSSVLSQSEISSIEREMLDLEVFRPQPQNVAEPINHKIGHNQRPQDHENVFLGFYNFYKYDVIALILLVLFGIKKSRSHPSLREATFFFGSLFLFAFSLKTFELLNAGFTSLAVIHESVPSLVVRTITNRFFNMSLVLAPVGVLSALAYFAIERKSFVSALAFTLFFAVYVRADLLPSLLMLDMLLFTGLGFVTFFVFYDSKLETSQKWLGNLGRIISTLMFTFFYFAVLAYFSYKTFTKTPFLFPHPFTQIEAILNSSPSPGAKKRNIIVGSNVTAVPKFNIQIQTGRPYIFPDGTAINIHEDGRLKLDIFCESNQAASPEINTQKECFEKRSLSVWKLIGRVFDADHVLVTRDYATGLPLVAEENALKLYKIPD